MSTRNVRLRYRPIRVGWCVRDGSIEDVRDALKLTHTLWGGAHNPIIPVGAAFHAEELVESYRVDALYPIREDQKLRRFIDEFPQYRWPLFEKELFITGSGGRRLSTLLDVYHPVRKIFEEFVKDKKEASAQATIFSWSKTEPLADVFLAFFGSYPEEAEVGCGYESLVRKNLLAEKIQLSEGKPVPVNAYRAFTPFGIAGFDLHRDRLPKRDYPGLYWGDSQNFVDIVNFWNLRAADIELMFFDPRHEDRLGPITDSYVELLTNSFKDPTDLNGGAAIWFREGSEPDATRFPKVNVRVGVGGHLWRGLKPPVMFISDESVLGDESEYFGSPSLSFEVRDKPFFFDEPELGHQHLAITVRPFAYGDEGESTFRFPFLPELNEFYRRKVSSIDEVRSEPNGLGIITKVVTNDLRIRAIKRRELIAAVLEAFGITGETSAAGRVASRLIQQMGDLQGCRVFKIAGVRNLIGKYKPLQSFSRTEAIQVIGNADPCTGIPNFAAYEDLYIEYREGGKLKPQQVFEYLLKQNVFRVGLRFDCPYCELDFWTPLDDVATDLACEYCGKQFNVTTQLKDRDWAYRRSGLFGREDHQQGAIPVAVTLQQLDIALNTDMVYVTSMNLRPASAAIEPCESDFVVLSEKGFEPRLNLAIGECKSSDEITDEDVRNLSKVANALTTDRVFTYIVFAKTSRFTPGEIDRCRLAQSEGRKRVILLSDRELEPYFVYQRAASEFAISATAVCLEDLAETTHALYFDPRPRSHS